MEAAGIMATGVHRVPFETTATITLPQPRENRPLSPRLEMLYHMSEPPSNNLQYRPQHPQACIIPWQIHTARPAFPQYRLIQPRTLAQTPSMRPLAWLLARAESRTMAKMESDLQPGPVKLSAERASIRSGYPEHPNDRSTPMLLQGYTSATFVQLRSAGITT